MSIKSTKSASSGKPAKPYAECVRRAGSGCPRSSECSEEVLQVGIGFVGLAFHRGCRRLRASSTGCGCQVPALRPRGTQLHAAALGGGQGVPGALRDPAGFVFRHGCEYVDRQPIGMGIVAGDEIRARRTSCRSLAAGSTGGLRMSSARRR